ncbi:MAG: uroporphyrinogen-III C-methyltransferase [Planctomycetes bacterium]|nr:uroporphyrinogen-III C-methyltransferase [Planctomycetota bacterium]
MRQPYLISLDLTDQPVLVIGGGRIATRKVEGLLDSGARITVIAPELSPRLRELAALGRVELIPRAFDILDLSRPALLTFAATNDHDLNWAIVQQLRRDGRLVNGADAESGRNFSTPATARTENATLAVATDEGDPVRAKGLLARAIELRTSRGGDSPLRGQSPLVTLVGAGPGNPDLLTVGGKREIELADVIVHDNLVHPDILKLARPGAELIAVGKHPFGEQVAQETINSILVREGSLGKRVVRLKGGDPFIFGRGTEEIEALHAAGVKWRVVPGVSSINGVSGAAGVTLTKRGRNHGFAVFSAATTPAEEIRRWARIEGPLAIFMGVHKAAIIAREFIAGGRDGNEPVVVVARGGTDTERVAETTLAELPKLLAQPEEWTPGLIIVGATREAAFRATATSKTDAAPIPGTHVFTRNHS